MKNENRNNYGIGYHVEPTNTPWFAFSEEQFTAVKEGE
jgi:hypothetical protein